MSWWSQVSETAAHGLQITIVGMLLVFFTLGLVILAVVLLTHLPGLRAQESQDEPQETPAAPPVPEIVVPAVDEDQKLAQVAAIALALVRSQHRRQTRLSARPTNTAWKSSGRVHQLGL